MPDQPLQPFSPPTALLSYLPTGSLSAGVAVVWALYAIFAFRAAYTIVAVHPWLKYSPAPLIPLPAIAVHILVSFALMSYALSGDALLLAPYLP